MLTTSSKGFILAIMLLAASGCSSSGGSNAATTDTDSGSSSDVGGDDAAVDAGTHAAPPDAPTATPGDGTGSLTFAITKLYLGDTDPDGTPDATNGWKSYGYDLDGKISGETSTDLCKPVGGATARAVYPDGNDGIDNSYGKNVLPITLGIASGAVANVNANLAAGKGTTLIDVQKLGSGTSYSPLSAALYQGADLGMAPKFDGTDVWPVTAESVSGGDVSQPKVVLSTSYLVGDTWVSGPYDTLQLQLPLVPLDASSPAVTVTLHHAVVTMKLDADHKHATRGIIAGVIATADLVTQLRLSAGAADPSLCSGPTIDSIVAQLEQASDIMVDGSQDPTKDCDGISIGLGFDASIVELGAVAAPVTPAPSPCQ